jgi:UDPglucose 6-dehydrogenase
MIIGIIGMGCVGKALYNSFKLKDINVICYDINNNINYYYNKLEDILTTDIVFLCLPTEFNGIEFDKSAINNICEYLNDKYNGNIVIKSTIEPNTTNILQDKYPNLKLYHNPEFLSASTAFEDFHNQSHIVIGKSNKYMNTNSDLETFYKSNYPDANISICSSNESESMKIFLNSFYAVKIQFFNELFLLCHKTETNYNNVLELMLKNNWINPMHTNIPGHDGNISYGGMCFPKDTNALNSFMKKNNIPNKVLESTINERNEMRKD